MQTDREVDARGLNCPLPILRTKKALTEMLNTKGAYLLEVMVGKENNVFPMVPQGCSVAEIRLK